MHLYITVQRLLEPENLKEWQRIGFGSAFEVKVDNVEKKLLQVAIKEAKVISGRIFQELKKRWMLIFLIFTQPTKKLKCK